MKIENRIRLLEAMTEIVERNVRYFKTDFTVYDIPYLCGMTAEDWNTYAVYWFIRSTGTDLFRTENGKLLSDLDLEILSMFADRSSNGYMLTADGEVVEIDLAEFV